MIGKSNAQAKSGGISFEYDPGKTTFYCNKNNENGDYTTYLSTSNNVSSKNKVIFNNFNANITYNSKSPDLSSYNLTGGSGAYGNMIVTFNTSSESSKINELLLCLETNGLSNLDDGSYAISIGIADNFEMSSKSFIAFNSLYMTATENIIDVNNGKLSVHSGVTAFKLGHCWSRSSYAYVFVSTILKLD